MAIKAVTVGAIHVLMPLLTHGAKSMEGKYSNRQIVQFMIRNSYNRGTFPKLCLVIEENFSEHSIVDFEK